MQLGAVRVGRSPQDVEVLRVDRHSRGDDATIGVPFADAGRFRPIKPRHTVRTGDVNPGQEIGLGAVWPALDPWFEAVDAQRDTRMVEGSAAAERQQPAVRIDRIGPAGSRPRTDRARTGAPANARAGC